MNAPHATHPLADPRLLVGTWRLRRTLEDRRAGMTGTAEGEVSIAPAGGGALDWRERMVLAWDGRRIRATRAYVLAPGPQGWQVRFDHGGAFHDWRPGEPVCHLCGDDRYVGRVEGGPAGWSVVWEVRGPRKDLVLTSLLTPR